MQLQSQVIARNTHKGPTVLSSDPKGTHYVEWDGADDPNGGDVQIVPEEIANSVPFIKAVQRGILVIENLEQNPDLQEALEKQNKAFADRTRKASEKALDAIDQQANNDMITLPCVGPASRGDGTCGADVPVREKTKNDKPPLCSTHSGLAHQYVPDEGVEGTQTVKRWVRVSMGQRERQQQ